MASLSHAIKQLLLQRLASSPCVNPLRQHVHSGDICKSWSTKCQWLHPSAEPLANSWCNYLFVVLNAVIFFISFFSTQIPTWQMSKSLPHCFYGQRKALGCQQPTWVPQKNLPIASFRNPIVQDRCDILTGPKLGFGLTYRRPAKARGWIYGWWPPTLPSP